MTGITMYTGTITVTSLAEVWIEMMAAVTRAKFGSVTSLAEVWIEIADEYEYITGEKFVTSLAEVWIEM